jgi:hypothetical protein
MFNPRSWLGIIGVMLFLIALYLVLEKAAGASSILGTLAAAGVAVFGTLQGRNVSGVGGVSVGGTP